jgi:pyridoxine 4-dehydrogenase
VEQVESLTQSKGCTAAQLAISWVQHNSKRSGVPTVIPIPGATAASRVTENSKLVELSEDEFTTISDMVHGFETAGRRYPEQFAVNT